MLNNITYLIFCKSRSLNIITKRHFWEKKKPNPKISCTFLSLLRNILTLFDCLFVFCPGILFIGWAVSLKKGCSIWGKWIFSEFKERMEAMTLSVFPNFTYAISGTWKIFKIFSFFVFIQMFSWRNISSTSNLCFNGKYFLE